jgi:hypothetical protein
MSGSDGMVSSSRVHVTMNTWEPVVMPCLSRHVMIVSGEDVGFQVTGSGSEAPECGYPCSWVCV